MFDVDVSELVGLGRDIAAVATRTPGKAGEAVDAAADVTKSVAQSIAPKRTGAYAASIHIEGSGTEQVVTTGVDYSIYVEFGTYKDSPQPTMFPAGDIGERELVDRLGAIDLGL